MQIIEKTADEVILYGVDTQAIMKLANYIQKIAVFYVVKY